MIQSQKQIAPDLDYLHLEKGNWQEVNRSLVSFIIIKRARLPMFSSRAITVLKNEGFSSLIIKSLQYLWRIILLDYIPMRLFAIAAPLYWKVHPNLQSKGIKFDKENGVWILNRPSGKKFYTPNPKIRHGQKSHSKARVDDYTLDDFVSVESDDTVVDVGPFVGGFSIGVAPIADQVIAIEPDSKNAASVCNNTSHFDNVTVIQKAVWKEHKYMDFNISSDPTDNSLLDPDWNHNSTTVTVEAERFDKLVNSAGLSNVDFLKMDAEGAEPEALTGIKFNKPRKIAVDCGAERNGENTKSEVLNILDDVGYETRTQKDIIFARLE